MIEHAAFEAGMDITAGAELRRLGNLVEIANTLPVWERPAYLLERLPQALLSPDLQKSRILAVQRRVGGQAGGAGGAVHPDVPQGSAEPAAFFGYSALTPRCKQTLNGHQTDPFKHIIYANILSWTGLPAIGELTLQPEILDIFCGDIAALFVIELSEDLQ